MRYYTKLSHFIQLPCGQNHNFALELSGLYNWFSQRRKISTFDNPITTVSH
ncbi:hypothetical protein T12_11433 [Trichinella patagoniensis]|uniref:Uncharacterized protein n=1 Tax=Trichinella patagoniensis TaxID=990121 RepID=A0A0V0YU07_9BILA|nr:hypothetical protein T12_831 [Trichinella patagoniensis]KRY03567.1 hypothetical protein T12_5110 [Trichinella patagoniensis]KRY03569.1 hypothetical protein T12_15937 [Trichinella patagoniensis]KRY03576.1 hypothetical protein T12_15799 [Trichinella patagoniensis]KRY03579.1 hypothetical protein T12_11433 [Trichinella patagoniensis]